MEETKDYVVYCHTNTFNNKKYIGQSCNLKRRWENQGSAYLHKNKQGEYTQPAFARAIEKYGWDNFIHEILAEGLTQEEADNLELFYIQKYNTTNSEFGYNIREGGHKGHLPQETKDKISIAHKGEKNYNYGQHLSQEHKNKIGQKTKELWATNADYRNKIINSLIGKPCSEETRKKISQATKGKHTNQSGENNSFYGKKHNEKSKKKMSDAKKTEEYKKKIREARGIKVLCVETGIIYNSLVEAEEQTGAPRTCIKRCIDGTQQRAGKLHWKKVENNECK